jgi:hypothetical protein
MKLQQRPVKEAVPQDNMASARYCWRDDRTIGVVAYYVITKQRVDANHAQILL